MQLWRCPPVLVVQLKRFQFDRNIRRKIYDKVDFPLDNLDISDYIASTRPSSTCENPQGKSLISPSDCTNYDLYAVIHHHGAMGEGHYVATCRSLLETNNKSSSSAAFATSSSTSQAANSASFVTSSRGSNDWVVYNDESTSLLRAKNGLTISDMICASSAYVLFYMRRDMIGQSVLNVFPPSREVFEKLKKEGCIVSLPTANKAEVSDTSKSTTAESKPTTDIDNQSAAIADIATSPAASTLTNSNIEAEDNLPPMTRTPKPRVPKDIRVSAHQQAQGEGSSAGGGDCVVQ